MLRIRRPPNNHGPAKPLKGEQLAQAQDIPLRFLENILGGLKQAGLVRSQRGPEGGYWLAHPADDISVADVIRAVEGPLASIRGERPDSVEYAGSARALQEVWIALRASTREVLECTTVADVASGRLPTVVGRRAEIADAWSPRIERGGARPTRR